MSAEYEIISEIHEITRTPEMPLAPLHIWRASWCPFRVFHEIAAVIVIYFMVFKMEWIGFREPELIIISQRCIWFGIPSVLQTSTPTIICSVISFICVKIIDNFNSFIHWSDINIQYLLLIKSMAYHSQDSNNNYIYLELE